MPTDDAEEISEILFNRFATKAAQRRALVDSWVAGVKDQYKSLAESDAKSDDDEDVETFQLESHSEIIGLGVDLTTLSLTERARLDPQLSGEDASTAFLRERLLGHTKNQPKPLAGASSNRTKLGMHGLEPGFSPYTHKPLGGSGEPGDGGGAGRNGQVRGGRAVEDEEDDEDEEVGRSGIGGRSSGRDGAGCIAAGGGGKGGKAKRKKAGRKGQERAGEDGGSDDGAANGAVEKVARDGSRNEGDDGEEGDDDGVGARVGTSQSGVSAASQAAAPKKRRAVSYLDELLAKKSKQKKKK